VPKQKPSPYRRMLKRLREKSEQDSRPEDAAEAWSVYVVRCSDGSLYTGVAKDAAARVDKHNSGRGAAYTRARRPVELLYREDGFSRGAALVREAAIKALPRDKKRALVGLGA
jgi:putative endonuclease